MKGIGLTWVCPINRALFVVVNPIAALVWPIVAGVLITDKLLSLRTVVAAEDTWCLFISIHLECMVSHCLVCFWVLLSESGIFVRGSDTCEDHLVVLTSRWSSQAVLVNCFLLTGKLGLSNSCDRLCLTPLWQIIGAERLLSYRLTIALQLFLCLFQSFKIV